MKQVYKMCSHSKVHKCSLLHYRIFSSTYRAKTSRLRKEESRVAYLPEHVLKVPEFSISATIIVTNC